VPGVGLQAGPDLADATLSAQQRPRNSSSCAANAATGSGSVNRVLGERAEWQPCQLSLLVRGGRCQARLLSCGGGGVADGQPDGPVAEICDEV